MWGSTGYEACAVWRFEGDGLSPPGRTTCPRHQGLVRGGQHEGGVGDGSIGDPGLVPVHDICCPLSELVFTPETSGPTSGSAMARQPMYSPEAARGISLFFYRGCRLRSGAEESGGDEDRSGQAGHTRPSSSTRCHRLGLQVGAAESFGQQAQQGSRRASVAR